MFLNFENKLWQNWMWSMASLIKILVMETAEVIFLILQFEFFSKLHSKQKWTIYVFSLYILPWNQAFIQMCSTLHKVQTTKNKLNCCKNELPSKMSFAKHPKPLHNSTCCFGHINDKFPQFSNWALSTKKQKLRTSLCLHSIMYLLQKKIL